MQYKFAFLFALLACSQALALAESTRTLYAMDKTRHQIILKKIKLCGDAQYQNYHLMNVVGVFALTCDQLYSAFQLYKYQDDLLDALTIVKNNIIDPQNKNDLLAFFSGDDKLKAIDLLATITVPCVIQGAAPEKFPVFALPYKDQWDQNDFKDLIKRIIKVDYGSSKLKIIKEALDSSSKVLSAQQAMDLYGCFYHTTDTRVLTTYIKDRIVGFTCDQAISFLSRFTFDDDRLEHLDGIKYNIIDVENKLTILESFYGVITQALASQILADIKPKNSLFGLPAGNILFLIDTSASMKATFTTSPGQEISRLDFVRKEFVKTISSLKEPTQFNVLSFSEGINIWKGYRLQKSSEANVNDAIKFIENLTPYGGTNMYDVLQLAWNVRGVDTIYLLADGSPNEGVTDKTQILADIKAWYAKTPIKINTIAFLMGTRSSDDKLASKTLMKAIAEATNGIYKDLESDL